MTRTLMNAAARAQRRVKVPSIILGAAFALACADSTDGATAVAAASRANAEEPGIHRQYGPAQKLGDGQVRSYVILDEKDGRTPIEVGVAIDASAMASLPAGMPAEHGSGHNHSNTYLLDLPAQNPTPYRFVMFDWNPNGHEPLDVYGLAHFDFHFYTVPVEVRNQIVPSDPQFMQKAASFPAPALRPPFYVDAASPFGAPPGAVTVPLMGLHWVDVRSPELQKLGPHPELWQPFTKTYFVGSWDGQFIFDEPMITRDYLLAKSDSTATDAQREEVVPVPQPAMRQSAGWWPSAYRIAYDAQAKEYRVALTGLSWKN